MSHEENLRAMHSIAKDYDVHYSNVRTTLSTFLVTLGFGLGAFFLGKDFKAEDHELAYKLALYAPGAIFLFATILNLHFQRLTWCCEKVQKEIEVSLKKESPSFVGFRQRLGELFNEESRLMFDPPAKLLVAGIASYYVLAQAIYTKHTEPRPVVISVAAAIFSAWVVMAVWNRLDIDKEKKCALCRAVAGIAVFVLLAAIPWFVTSIAGCFS